MASTDPLSSPKVERAAQLASPAGFSLALAELLSLAAPTVLQMASYTVMQFIDTLMLTSVGDIPATAAGGAGMFAWTILSFGIGTLFLVNTLASQSFGRRDLPEAGRFFWQGIWWSAFCTPLIAAATLALPWTFARMGHGQNLLDAERTYLHIVVLATPVKLVATAAGQFLLAIDRPMSVMVAAVAGVVVDVLVGAVLVLGYGIDHSWGVSGAGWAQVVGTSTEMIVLLAVVANRDVRKLCNLKDLSPHWRELGTLIRIGVPSGLQVIAEMLAWSLFVSWVVEGISQEAMSANVYVFKYMSMSFMPAIGIGTAVTALVGRYIGRGDPDAAVYRAHLGFGVTAVFMLVCGAVFFTFRGTLMRVFTQDQAVLQAGAILLMYAAFYQLFDAMYCVYNGALRGAGDTTVPAIAMGGFCWIFCVAGGRLVVAHWPGLGVHGPWIMAMTYGASIGTFLMVRFLLGGWRTIRLETGAE
jgi:multidrug resistance protein, MATE family